MRIVVTGGGTAGHVSPILAVVGALKRRDRKTQILYIGQKAGLEAQLAREAGMIYAGISAGKYRRVPGSSITQKLTDFESLALNVRDIGRVSAGVVQSLGILRRFRPDVVFAKGGFVAIPVAVAARILRIPVICHESDIEPGIGTKIVSRWAVKVGVGFPADLYPRLPQRKLVFTGNPVRPEVLKGDPEKGRAKYFGRSAPKTKPTVLVMGGSQGAQTINNFVIAAAPELDKICRIIHVTGQLEFQRIAARAKAVNLDPSKYTPKPFLSSSDLGQAYALADLVVSRAGANTIAELAALAKPVILIPNRLMAAHQLVNARQLYRSGAALLLHEEDLTGSALAAAITELLDSKTERKKLGNKLASFNVPDSAEHLANLIHEAGGSR